MQTLHFSITINAPREKVWETMLEAEGYSEWTKEFNSQSHFEGSWEQGSSMKFIGVDDNGKMGGMLSTIAMNKKPDFMSIKHLGMFVDGVEDTSSAEVKEWAGAMENYTLKEKNGGTELLVDIDTVDNHKEYFEKTWPKALARLKELAEKK